MEDIIDIIVTETTNLIEITSQPTDEIIDVNIIDNREDVTLNVTPTLVEININSLTGNFGILWGEIEGTLSNQTDLQNVLNLKADLVDGKVPSSQLPSYVDDVVEVVNYAALPVTGEVGKIYITLDTNYIYRWTGSTYVEIKDSSAVWGAITGTLSNQTDLQNALNLKANDSLVVHLAGTETITGAKTFSSAVTAPNFVLSGGTGNTGLYYGHTDRVVLANYTTGGIDFEVNGGSIVATLFPSGNYGLGITLDAGYKLDVNGTTRISGALSGTSASFSSSVTASSLIKSGGTSSQFLKADGSVDSNTYLTTSSAASTYVSGSGVTDYYARFTGTKVIADGFIRTTSNITYVEGMGLSTGNGLDIEGAYGAGGGGLKIRSYDETTGNAYIDFANTGGRMYLGLNRSTSGGLMTNATAYATVLTTGLGTSNLEFGTNATKRLTIDGTTGAVTLTGALSGTSATFSGAINLTGTANSFQVASIFRNANRVFFGGDTGGYYFQNSGNTATVLQIADSGAATFSSSVTATAGTFTGDVLTNGVLSLGGANSILSTDKPHLFRISGGGLGISANNEGAGNQPINFYTSGTLRATITSSGNVGIGTTSPNAKLEVNGYGTANSIMTYVAAKFYGAGTGGINLGTDGTNPQIATDSSGVDLTFLTRVSGVFSERMRITSSGNVGIGTTSPFGKLSVDVTSAAPSSSGNMANGLTVHNTSFGRALQFGVNDSGAYNYIQSSYVNNADVGVNLAFFTGASERMRIGATGFTASVKGASDSESKTFMDSVSSNCGLIPTMAGTTLYLYGRNSGTNYRALLTASTYFTGQHGNKVVDLDLKENIENYVGMIVSSDGTYYSVNPITQEITTGKDAISISEALPQIKLTNKDKDKSIWGVVTNVKNDNYNTDGDIETDNNTEWGDRLGENVIRVNGLGEGAIWVTNINGNLENGDYICSSIIPGFGRKQDDDLLHNYSVAKITMDCDFDLNNDNLYKCEEFEFEGQTYKKAFVGCTYHCS